MEIEVSLICGELALRKMIAKMRKKTQKVANAKRAIAKQPLGRSSLSRPWELGFS